MAGACGVSERLFADAHRVGEEIEQGISRRLARPAGQCPAGYARDAVEIAQVEPVVVPVERGGDAQPFERCDHLLPVGEVFVERVVAEAYDPFAGAGPGGLRSEPCEVFGAHDAVGHFHVGPAVVAQEKVASRTVRDAPVMAEYAAECRASALRPGRFMVAHDGEPRFFELRHQPVHVLQILVAARVGEIPAEDDQFGIRRVGFGDGHAEERVLCIARRDMYVGEKDDVQRIGRGGACLRRGGSGVPPRCVIRRRGGSCRRRMHGDECRQAPRHAEAQPEDLIFHGRRGKF